MVRAQAVTTSHLPIARVKRRGEPREQQTRNSSVIDEVRLLHAVKALDSSSSSSGSDAGRCDAPQRLCEALRYFIELLLLFAVPGATELPATARTELETVWEARILTCLQRFVAKRKHEARALVDTCACSDSGACVQLLVHYTLLSIVYHLARAPRMAIAVVKTGLHALALDALGIDMIFSDRSTSNDDATRKCSSQHPSSQSPTKCSTIADPRDLLLAIDPFDWCYQSTCAKLAASSDYEGDSALCFLEPVGLRSLAYLLAGEPLPTDEITEHDALLRSNKSGDRGSDCYSPQSTKQRRQLPSIFTFPIASVNGKQTEPHARVCARRLDPVFRVLATRAASHHVALRTVTALLLNLPRASLERKALVRQGTSSNSSLAALLRAHALTDRISQARVSDRRCDTNEITDVQLLAIGPHVLARIAQSALSLLQDDDDVVGDNIHSSAATSSLHKLLPTPESLRLNTSACRAPLASPTRSGVKRLGSSATTSIPSTLSLVDRLGAASDATKRELAAIRPASPRKRDRALQRARRRQQLRVQCEHLEQMRQDLNRSLFVLHSGRIHADPRQCFMDWIESLPTIEKHERERRDCERQREQHRRKKQAEREEAHKRQLHECTLMLQNDCRALDETERLQLEHQQRAFVDMRTEMQQLQQAMDDNDDAIARIVSDNDGIDIGTFLERGIDGTTLPQKTLLTQRKQRQQRIDDNGRRMEWVRARRREAQELVCMAREDLYYVEQLLRRKQLEQAQQRMHNSVDPLEEQQRRIERMRQLDREKQLATAETERMRTEDLVARQKRYVESEQIKQQLQRERLARKHMETEERECRARWTLLAQEQHRADALEAKRLRIEARQLRKAQEAYDRQVLAAWIESWDANGNVYYYNNLTGISQWERPLSI